MRVLEPLSWYEMYTVGPSEVIHWRSACVVSMICALQFAKLFDVSAFRQVTAETPNRAAVNGGLTKATSEVKWRVPVDPMSTSAASPPNCLQTIPLSGIPWKAGGPPNAGFQQFVPNLIQESDVKTVVPSGPIVTAGSLLPLFNSNALFENVIVEVVPPGLPALTDETSNENATAKPITPINLYRMTPPSSGRQPEGDCPPNTFPQETKERFRVIGNETGGSNPNRGCPRSQRPTGRVRWLNPHSLSARLASGSLAFGLPRTGLYLGGGHP